MKQKNHRAGRRKIFSSLDDNRGGSGCGSMPLTVKWDEGVSIEFEETKLVFDPQRNRHHNSEVFISHAHYDHSKGFRFQDSRKTSTEETKKIVAAYGRNEINNWRSLSNGERVKVGDLTVVSHNAGHVLGSSLYEVITPEATIVYTGDLQFQDSFTMEKAEPVSCEMLIIDSTFGSKSFRFPERDTVASEMVTWAKRTIRNGKVPAFKADSLGNAQEVIRAFNVYTNLPVTVHQRVAQISEIYNNCGHKLEFVSAISEEAYEVASSGECIFVAPKSVNLTEHPQFEPALVSGWAVWTRKNKAFALSDHADFDQLMSFIRACEPRIVLTCFGSKFNHTFARQIESMMWINAWPLNLIPVRLS